MNPIIIAGLILLVFFFTKVPKRSAEYLWIATALASFAAFILLCIPLSMMLVPLQLCSGSSGSMSASCSLGIFEFIFEVGVMQWMTLFIPSFVIDIFTLAVSTSNIGILRNLKDIPNAQIIRNINIANIGACAIVLLSVIAVFNYTLS